MPVIIDKQETKTANYYTEEMKEFTRENSNLSNNEIKDLLNKNFNESVNEKLEMKLIRSKE